MTAPTTSALDDLLDGFDTEFGGPGIGGVLPSAAARAELSALRAQPNVTICRENRAQGDGGCGACALCCKEATEERDVARIQLSTARREALEEAARVCDVTAAAMGAIGPLGYAGAKEAAKNVRALAAQPTENQT